MLNDLLTPENRYGMHLTPEEAQNSELLRNLAAQQALQMQHAQLYAQQQQAQRYSHGWYDARNGQAPMQLDRFPVQAADAVIRIRARKKLKPYHYLFALSLLLVIIGIIFGV